MFVIRTWKRDGSVNVMSFEAAVGVIRRNCKNPGDDERIRERLMRGAEYETKYSFLQLDTRNPKVAKGANNEAVQD